MVRSVIVLALLVAAFSVGVRLGHAQANEISMRGTVKDANTITEQVQYWEIRGQGQPAASISIIGDRDLPLIAWLRTAKERNVVLTIARE